MADRLTPLLFGMLATLVAGASEAQALTDPTRPPFGSAASATSMPGDVVPGSSSLQSTIMRKSGRPAALINGSVTELGGKVGEARLVKVDDDSVVLLSPDGSRETLKLTPEAEKISKVGAGRTAKPIGMNAYREEKREGKLR